MNDSTHSESPGDIGDDNWNKIQKIRKIVDSVSNKSQVKFSDIEIDHNDSCPCGSGNQYSKCCRPWHAVSEEPVKWWSRLRVYLENEQYQNALGASRAGYSAYWKKYKRHTEKIYLIDYDLGNQILRDIDVPALSEAVVMILNSLRMTGMASQAIQMLSRLEGRVLGKDWEREIAYLKSLSFSLDGKPDDAWDCLPPVAQLIEMPRLCHLTLAYELSAGRIGYLEREEIRERIIRISDSPDIVLQYKLAGAISLLSIGDMEGAQRRYREAKSDYAAEDEDNLDLFIRIMFAKAFRQFGCNFSDKESLSIGLQKLEEFATDKDLPQGLRSGVEIEFALGLLAVGQRVDGKNWLISACARRDDPMAFVYLAEFELFEGNLLGAKSSLDKASSMEMDAAASEDLIMAKAKYARASNDPNLIKKSLDDLKKIKPSIPMLRDRQMEHIVMLNDVASQGSVRNAIDFANSAVILKPSFAGFGIDFNYILSRLLGKRKR